MKSSVGISSRQLTATFAGGTTTKGRTTDKGNSQLPKRLE